MLKEVSLSGIVSLFGFFNTGWLFWNCWEYLKYGINKSETEFVKSVGWNEVENENENENGLLNREEENGLLNRDKENGPQVSRVVKELWAPRAIKIARLGSVGPSEYVYTQSMHAQHWGRIHSPEKRILAFFVTFS